MLAPQQPPVGSRPAPPAPYSSSAQAPSAPYPTTGQEPKEKPELFTDAPPAYSDVTNYPSYPSAPPDPGYQDLMISN